MASGVGVHEAEEAKQEGLGPLLEEASLMVVGIAVQHLVSLGGTGTRLGGGGDFGKVEEMVAETAGGISPGEGRDSTGPALGV